MYILCGLCGSWCWTWFSILCSETQHFGYVRIFTISISTTYFATILLFRMLLDGGGGGVCYHKTEKWKFCWTSLLSSFYRPFYDTNTHATEELYYKRAIDQFEVDRATSFVVSVPYDAGTRNDSLVTATRAIFVRKQMGRDIAYAPVK